MQHSSKFVDHIAIYITEVIDKMKMLGLSSGHKQNSPREYPRRFPLGSFPTLSVVAPAQTKNIIRSSAKSHAGIVRMHSPNEDSYLHMTTTRPTVSGGSQSVGLFLVADGMGGHSDGKYASAMVVEMIRAAIEPDLKDPRIGSDELRDKLVQSVQDANAQLFHENEKAGALCGTTVTGTLLIEQLSGLAEVAPTYIAHVINVGDSRTYCHSMKNGFSRITRDHSIVEGMVALGIIRPEERYTHKERNKIYRCVGEKIMVDVDTFTLTLQQGDQLLICSDGLWEMVRDDDLASFFTSGVSEPSMITPHLVQAALNRGGSDNVTAIVVMVADEARYPQFL